MLNDAVIEGFRLSTQQKDIWRLADSYAGESPYRSLCSIAIRGPLDAPALRSALDKVLTRHEIPRTTFRAIPGMAFPVQVVADEVQLCLAEHDLTGFRPQDQDAKLAALWDDMRRRPFDLENGPLIALTLAALAADNHVLTICLPALCVDAAALQILMRELCRCYGECLSGNESDADDPVQYIDLSEWQHDVLDAEDGARGIAYWRGKDFSDVPAPLFYFEKEPQPGSAFEPQSISAAVADISPARLAGAFECPIPSSMLACWHALIGRLSGRMEVVTGTYFDGRPYQQMEDCLGPFSRRLPIRSLRKSETMTDFAASIDRDLSEASEWQGYFSWDHIASSPADPPPSWSLGFEFVNAASAVTAGGVAFSMEKQLARSTPHKLNLVCRQDRDALSFEIHYDSRLFEREDILRLSRQYQVLLRAACDNPAARLETLSVLTDDQVRQLLVDWNDTQADYARETPFHELFANQAERNPAADAVIWGAERLTYRELDIRANQLAHYLRNLGVGPDVVVGLCIARSVEMVVGLLGVLKAGGTYLPLTADYPAERLAFMLEDSRARVIVTQERLREKLPKVDAKVVCIDADWAEIAREDEIAPANTALPGSLAYIIYTSGSTGKPKGVMISHQGLSNYLTWSAQAYRVESGSGSVVHSTLAFDLTVTSLVAPLSAGQRVHLLDEDSSIEDLGAIVRSSTSLSLIKITPAHLELLAQELHGPANSGDAKQPVDIGGRVNTLVIGGESLAAEGIAFWRRHAPETRIINEYGPTETVVGCCVYEVAAGSAATGPVPIGNPIANTQLYILDNDLSPVPIGVEGELYIGGDGLARGYLNRPELTAGTFVPNPFSAVPGARMYRTGDLARYLRDGNIDCLGRIDHQVKLRGYRIELPEIETALLEHPAIGAAVVVAREDTPGDKRLVAYSVIRSGHAVEAAGLRAFVKARLPEYMTPAAFVFLDALPLTSNGKVDRKALPEPASGARVAAGGPPQTVTEELVAQMWSDVLRVDHFGRKESFFDLGGHSLLATQIVSRIRQIFEVDVSLRVIFEAPTLAELSKRIEEARREGEGLSTPPITPALRDGLIPLSFAQQRLWFIDQLEPQSAVYNIPTSLRLHGALNIEALERTVNEILRRHEVLRTTFGTVDAQPVQIVRPYEPIKLAVTSLEHVPPDGREDQARRLAAMEAARPFDLAAGPLLRANLLVLGAQEYVALLTLHHIVGDGWSMGLLVKEVAALYDAFASGLPSPLPELAIQYADFAVWQRKWLQGEVLDKQMAYWKGHLAELPTLDLPTDRPRSAVPSYLGADARITVLWGLTDSLKELSRREGATLFMTLLAAWMILLARYSGQDDIVVGSPIAGRNREETEDLIGFFVNTLVLRAGVSDSRPFPELLARIRAISLAAYSHQDIPFEQLVEEVAPARDLSRHPLFQVMFMLHDASSSGSLSLKDITLSPFGRGEGTAKFDLTLGITDTGGGLDGGIEYATALFDAPSMERMARHYETLLVQLGGDFSKRIGDLSLLTSAERDQLLAEFNDTRAELPNDPCLHRLFERQADQTPHAVAVVFEGGELTYQELNAKANQLARHLQARGVGPDVRVGLLVNRSLDMAVGLLGILKAGGAYVPLDPAYPPDRLTYSLEDSRAVVLVTQEGLHARDASSNGCLEAVCLDRDRDDIARLSPDNLPSAVTPDHLAYVIYTSGSTGKPKGVAISHGAILAFLFAMQKQLRLSAHDILLAVTTLSFDIAGLELFLPLTTGARVVIAGREVAVDAELLARAISGCGATVMQATPATWQMLVESGWSGAPALTILCGGEALSGLLAGKLLERGGALWNMYGPTETTVWSLMHRVDAASGDPPIGRPIANTTSYVLNRDLDPCPIGVLGELYIGGAGLARGYMNQPRQTAERFIPDPFSESPGARLYRTGDVVRYRTGGNTEYLGRVDQQVKLRGFRIELGEIEAVLTDDPAVASAVVAVRDGDDPGYKQLVAYLVAHDGHVIDMPALRSALKTRLPGYMIPAAYVVLDALPRTPNGKVDRKALPAPEQTSETVGRPPLNLLEELIAQIWSGVLKVDNVHRNAGFFELGGHSLLATQVVSRVRGLVAAEIPLRLLFEAPALSDFADRVQAIQQQNCGPVEPPITRAARTGVLPLSFAQKRLWFLNQMEPDNGAYNMPFSLTLKGDLDIEALSRSCDEIIRRHEVLRTRIVTVRGEPMQEILPPYSLELPVLDLSGSADAQSEPPLSAARRIANEEAHRPFDLSAGPVRALILRLAPGDHIVLFTIHHIAGDAWSAGILARELTALYAAFRAGQPSPLAELGIQYADYAVWQRETLKGEILDRQLAYWRGQLAGLAALELPADFARPAVPTHRAASVPLLLSPERAEAVQDLSRKHDVTLFMTLVAAWQLVLSRRTGQNDIAIGTDVAGRNRTETEDLVGFFINQLVLRCRLDDGMSFSDLLRQTRETTLSAYAFQDLPFERLVEELAPVRAPGRSPLFQVKLVLQNMPEEELQFSGVETDSLSTDVQETKMDLHLMLGYSAQHGISGNLRYATDLFERESAARLLRQFEMVLESAVADPDQPLSAILRITGDERRQIEEEWTVDEESLLARLDQLSEEEIERLLGESEPKGASIS